MSMAVSESELAEASLADIEWELGRRRQIYAHLWDTAPIYDGRRIWHVKHGEDLVEEGMRRLGLVIDLAVAVDFQMTKVLMPHTEERPGAYERLPHYVYQLFKQMRRWRWIDARLVQGAEEYLIYEIELLLPPETLNNVPRVVTELEKPQTDAKKPIELPAAHKCLWEGSFGHPSGRFVGEPIRLLKARFGADHDYEQAVDELIDAHLAEWRGSQNAGTNAERLYLLPPAQAVRATPPQPTKDPKGDSPSMSNAPTRLETLRAEDLVLAEELQAIDSELAVLCETEAALRRQLEEVEARVSKLGISQAQKDARRAKIASVIEKAASIERIQEQLRAQQQELEELLQEE